MVTRLIIFLLLLLPGALFGVPDGGGWQIPKNTKAYLDSLGATTFKQIVAEPAKYLHHFEAGMDTAMLHRDTAAMAQLYTHLALANYYLGNYDKSTGHRLDAIALYEKLGDSLAIGHQYCELGYGMKRRNLDKAFEYMRQGVKILEQTGDRRALAADVNNFGVLFEFRHQIDSAIYYYNMSLEIKEEFNDSLGMAYSLINIFQALLLDNRPDSALPYLERAHLIRNNIKDELGITENQALYGDYYFQTGQYKKAIAHYETALERSRGHGYTYLMQYAAQKLSECNEKLGKPQQSLKYYKLYSQLKDSLLNEKTNKAIAELEVQFETEKKEKEIAQQRTAIVQNELRIRQRNTWLAGLGILLLVILAGSVMVYRQQKFRQAKLIEENRLKDQIAEITLVSELQEERLRISRDLHDNIGSQLTFIISSLDNLMVMMKTEDEKVRQRISNINSFTRDTISQFRDTIWAMNKKSITADEIRARIMNTFNKSEAENLPQVNFEGDFSAAIEFSGKQGMHVFRVLQEAINNAVKYAKAEIIKVQLTEKTNEIELNVSDDGQGFDLKGTRQGNGLKNMKNRVTEMGGSLEVSSSEGNGTEIRVLIPKNTA